MAKVYEFLANGFEEIEGLAPVDILRRGGIDVTTVSITGSREVTTSHGVTILADTTFEDAGEMTDADLLMLPAACPALPISTPMRECWRYAPSVRQWKARCGHLRGTDGSRNSRNTARKARYLLTGIPEISYRCRVCGRAVYRRRQCHHRRRTMRNTALRL